jgi:hypothetical protein
MVDFAAQVFLMRVLSFSTMPTGGAASRKGDQKIFFGIGLKKPETNVRPQSGGG